MTERPTPDLADWELKIVDTAMMFAESATVTMDTVFCERVRALEVVGATKGEVTEALDALRDELVKGVDAGLEVGKALAADWWRR